ncbi:aspartate 1-decarboxylase [Desulfarculus baarsii DSM 2075]|uniref:Aspartate 1-decarboxylase n=1 Tax=Desulfarculus baarsii (strain ATCC 33931 / DSM 2075 / LMG 7858 / VKM B-1802 / 2st14) TaxID=644282 RepID=E1QFH2_DESB2|nr:aspartate 1-decarboxylase [Desulfarculus baarsii]ADK84308.1 aspartate 1-decarboxylase [Desulfarculus baarsii DSM 2075]
MHRWMMKSKIHRATVTQADLNYEGSITVDQELLDAAEIIPHEMVQVYNVNTGSRFETYVIPGEPGSRVICLNGAAARMAQIGDLVILVTTAWLNEAELVNYEPKVVLVGEGNEIKRVYSDAKLALRRIK